MKNGRLRGICALVLLALLATVWTTGLAQAVNWNQAQSMAEVTPDQNDGLEVRNLFRIGGHTVTLPDDWSVVMLSNGRPQIQFFDTDGKRGLCVIFASRVKAYTEGLDADGLLAEVCKTLGGDAYQTQQVGERKVAIFDVLQDIDRNITHAVFMEGMDVYVIQLRIEESPNTMRQQIVATEIVGYFDAP